MTDEEIAKLKDELSAARASLESSKKDGEDLTNQFKETKFQNDVLKSNCDLLEKQLAEMAAEHQDVAQRLAEAATAQKALVDLVKTAEPRLEALKRANELRKNQVARLTRLHDLAAERARGVKNALANG